MKQSIMKKLSNKDEKDLQYHTDEAKQNKKAKQQRRHVPKYQIYEGKQNKQARWKKDDNILNTIQTNQSIVKKLSN